MNGTISRILAAIANALRGFWKATVKLGRVTMEWVAERAVPAIWDITCDLADATGRTLREAAHAVPNLLTRLKPRGSASTVAPAPSDASAPLDAQRQARQTLLDLADDQDRKRLLAITVRAAARALLRDQQPVGISPDIRQWLATLTPEQLSILATMAFEDITRALNGHDDQPLGRGMGSPAVATKEQATPVAVFRAHVEARAQERLQRCMRGMPASDSALLRSVGR